MSLRTETPSVRRDPVPGDAAPIRPPSGRRDRRAVTLVASIALVAASVAAFTSLYGSADRKTPAVVLVRPVAQGDVLTGADLGEVDVAVAPGVGVLPFGDVGAVVGRRAATALPAGSLLSTADLSDGPAIAPGDAVVGLALKDGAYPASGLSAGDQVLVVETAAPGASVGSLSGASTDPTVTPAGTAGVTVTGPSGADTGVLVPRASVFGVTAPGAASSSGATLLVSIEVPAGVAAQVATAAVAGQVGLVLLAPVARGATNSTEGGPSTAPAGSAGQAGGTA